MDMTTNLIAAAPVRLLILDCDGVLIDSEPIAAQADALAIRKTSRTGVRPSADELMRRFTGKSSAAMVGLLQSDYGVEDVGAWVEAKARVLDELFRRSLRPVRGVLETLAAFDEAGLAFCVASNSGRTRLRTAFEATGLTDRLRGRWFSAEEVSEGKPAPDLHLHAAARMGFAPEECLVVDDSPTGILGARRAGMRAWGFTGVNRLGAAWERDLLDAGAERLVSDFTVLLELCSDADLCNRNLDDRRVVV